jgi:phenylalanine-4-hydroxylase
MGVGQHIVSAYNGPADLNSFDLITHQITESTIKSKKDEKRKELERFYEQIRHFREGKNTTVSRNKVFQALKKDHPKDWLLPVELYELAKQDNNQEFQQEILEHLENIKRDNPKVGHLIDDGLQLVDMALVS